MFMYNNYIVFLEFGMCCSIVFFMTTVVYDLDRLQNIACTHMRVLNCVHLLNKVGCSMAVVPSIGLGTDRLHSGHGIASAVFTP